MAYKAIPADDAKIAALSSVPQALEKQFDSYSLYRLNEFNRHRSGGAVQETTISGDRGTGLRFFGYAKQVHKEVPDLRLLAGPRIGELAEKWMQYLRAPPRKLKGSSLANYMQSLIQLSAFANSLLEEGAPDPPTIEMLNLRKQGEMLAKQDKLFAKQSDTWMDWSTVQECRVKSLERHYSLNTLASLKDAIIINFHSLQAPDRGEDTKSLPFQYCTHKNTTHCSLNAVRVGFFVLLPVGVVRRLRFDLSLYQDKHSVWVVDLCHMKHKTTKCTPPPPYASALSLSDPCAHTSAPTSVFMCSLWTHNQLAGEGARATCRGVQEAPHLRVHGGGTRPLPRLERLPALRRKLAVDAAREVSVRAVRRQALRPEALAKLLHILHARPPRR